MMWVLVMAAIAGGCSTPSPTTPRSEGASVFASVRIKDAITVAGPDRLVIVDFTATWCVPCRLMEQTVWHDPRIEAWMAGHKAIAVRSDADANTDERNEYGVSAWPTTVVIRRGEVVERRLGSMSVEQLLGMLGRAGGEAAPAMEIPVLPPERRSR